jgi:hypothetical protein
MKGYNALETAQHMRQMWDSFDDPVALMLDAARFDQHVSRAALEYEHEIYNWVYNRDSELAGLLRMQLRNTGLARTPEGKLKYEVDGCRMSGDMNTSLGNCLLMCAMVWALGKQCGVRLRLANNGDDCCIICNRTDLARLTAAIPSHFKKLGFTMEVEPPVYVFEEIDFCQTHPVWRGDAWIMCRDPRVALAKDCHTVLPMRQRGSHAAYCKAVGDCGMALGSKLPVMQEFYRSLQRSGGSNPSTHQTIAESGFARLASGMISHAGDVSDAARVSFWRAFGLMPWHQEILEKHYAATHYRPEVCRREVRSPDFTLATGLFC